VVYLDGYAGPGRYEPEAGDTTGVPGSPLLAVQNASTVAQWARDLHCIFIERNPTYADNLRQVLSHEAPATLQYDILEGDVETRLADALAIAGDSPLLAFLDPFGTALPYQQMVDRLMLRGANVKTEVLLNLNLEMVWRIGGF
jgi:three-Cys-motif partner protein